MHEVSKKSGTAAAPDRTPTISRLAYRPLFHALKLVGTNPQAFTDATGISHDLTSNFDELVSAVDYYAAWHAAIELTGQPLLGLICGANMHPGNMGALGYCMMNSPLTGDALRLLFRYRHMDNRSIDASLDEDGDDVVVSLKSPLMDPATVAPFMEMMASGYGRMFNQLTDFQVLHKYQYRAVHFAHTPRAEVAVYEKLLRCPVHFEQDACRVILDSGTLYEKVHQADPSVFDTLIHTISEATQFRPGQTTVAPGTDLIGAVHGYLHQHISAGLPESRAVAAALAMSLSTFKRRLQAHGLTYRELCRQFRIRQAQRLINANALSVSEVAFMLGFSSASAFSRAFKQWTGQAPTDYLSGELKTG
ncbi:AraC family transcriptional regulator [Candidatus Marimicrobium litorale]|uniref:AraC family transcriptional regulator n=1 Tax=Candidatus Marimicrobium litorale TaxID=2518991 RepID=A0ABT3TA33_9GAMM|nr:AraC family transcriptional regulator [Candidatus Marimicrobium litorale]MCX2978904.1 AraC family transcriptional regulator [Candidatus Marimicrobium litorale]